MDDWYNTTKEDFIANGGLNIIRKYNKSVSTALKIIYPFHKWKLERFKYKPRGYWDIANHQSEFFSRLGDQLGYTQMDDWYNVTTEDITKNGGASVLAKYNYSPSKALMCIYPQHNWMIWRFKIAPFGYWEHVLDDVPQLTKLIEWLGEKLGCRDVQDWQRVSMLEVNKVVSIGSNRLLLQILQKVYSQHSWQTSKKISQKKSMQWKLVKAVKQLFPNEGAYNAHTKISSVTVCAMCTYTTLSAVSCNAMMLFSRLGVPLG